MTQEILLNSLPNSNENFCCNKDELSSPSDSFISNIESPDSSSENQNSKDLYTIVPGMKIAKGPDEQKLKELLERTGYSHFITAGQRKYGGPPPDWEESLGPPVGCEIYCGKIPKDIYEDELIPLFERIGKIWDFRLMIDSANGGISKGFAFVQYTNKELAENAVKTLDNYEIRPGKYLKLNISIPNLRLFVGNIPKSKSKDEIFEEFNKLTEGLVDVIVYSTPGEKRKNRGFCFLQYESHLAASVAKKRLTNNIPKQVYTLITSGCLSVAGGNNNNIYNNSSNIGGAKNFPLFIRDGHTAAQALALYNYYWPFKRVWNCDIIVEWAQVQEEPPQETMAKVKVLYVSNLTNAVEENDLKVRFEEYGPIQHVKKVKDYAFIHFNERDHALKAMDALNGLIDVPGQNGLPIKVSLAKPPSEKKSSSSSSGNPSSPTNLAHNPNYISELAANATSPSTLATLIKSLASQARIIAAATSAYIMAGEFATLNNYNNPVPGSNINNNYYPMFPQTAPFGHPMPYSPSSTHPFNAAPPQGFGSPTNNPGQRNDGTQNIHNAAGYLNYLWPYGMMASYNGIPINNTSMLSNLHSPNSNHLQNSPTLYGTTLESSPVNNKNYPLFPVPFVHSSNQNNYHDALSVNDFNKSAPGDGKVVFGSNNKLNLSTQLVENVETISEQMKNLRSRSDDPQALNVKELPSTIQLAPNHCYGDLTSGGGNIPNFYPHQIPFYPHVPIYDTGNNINITNNAIPNNNNINSPNFDSYMIGPHPLILPTPPHPNQTIYFGPHMLIGSRRSSDDSNLSEVFTNEVSSPAANDSEEKEHSQKSKDKIGSDELDSAKDESEEGKASSQSGTTDGNGDGGSSSITSSLLNNVIISSANIPYGELNLNGLSPLYYTTQTLNGQQYLIYQPQHTMPAVKTSTSANPIMDQQQKYPLNNEYHSVMNDGKCDVDSNSGHINFYPYSYSVDPNGYTTQQYPSEQLNNNANHLMNEKTHTAVNNNATQTMYHHPINPNAMFQGMANMSINGVPNSTISTSSLHCTPPSNIGVGKPKGSTYHKQQRNFSNNKNGSSAKGKSYGEPHHNNNNAYYNNNRAHNNFSQMRQNTANSSTSETSGGVVIETGKHGSGNKHRKGDGTGHSNNLGKHSTSNSERSKMGNKYNNGTVKA